MTIVPYKAALAVPKKGADDDEGCQTGVGRSRSRKGAGLEQEQGRSKNRAGAG